MADKIRMEVPFFQTPNRIFEVDGLTEHELITYMYLCRCGNNGGAAFPSYNDIGNKTKTSQKTAQRAIEGLIDKGLIIKHNRKGKSKNGNIVNISNIYEVNINLDTHGQTDHTPIVRQTIPHGQTDHIKRTIEKELLEKELTINIDGFDFEKLWELYPLKRGRGNVSKTKINELKEIGFETLKKAIERYVKDTELRRKDFPELNYKNGSTFFNSGYKDYVDDNFEYYKPKDKANQNPIQATNYEQREYDEDYYNSLYDNVTFVKTE